MTCKVTNEGLRAVSRLPALTSLDLTCCFKVTDEGLRAVSCRLTLTSLHLNRCNITNEGLRAVSRLPALRSLNLTDCHRYPNLNPNPNPNPVCEHWHLAVVRGVQGLGLRACFVVPLCCSSHKKSTHMCACFTQSKNVPKSRRFDPSHKKRH